MHINKNYFVYYKEDECCLKIFESRPKGLGGFLHESDYINRFNQLLNLPITMKKIYINILATVLLMDTLDKYIIYFNNLPIMLEELNITIFIPDTKKCGSTSLEAQKKFDIFFCQITKIPFGCISNIRYLAA